MKSERLHDFTAREDTRWRFNLSRAPWWGGQYERIVRLVKQALYKSIGKTSLTFNEIEEVLLDVEQTLNNRPLSYVEDDIQLPVLTPNSLIVGQPNLLPTEKEDYLVDKGELRKRFHLVLKCKDSAWTRWTQEYLKGTRERHNLKYDGNRGEPSIGDVVIIKGDEKNRGRWKLGIVTDVFPGKDGVVRAVELRTQTGTLQRPVQLLYPLELSCDIKQAETGVVLNVDAEEYRPRRTAAEIAKIQIQSYG